MEEEFGERKEIFLHKKEAGERNRRSLYPFRTGIPSFCIAYSFYRKGEAGVRIVYPALLSVNFSAFSLRLALPPERGKFLERRPIYIAVGLDIFLLFCWLFFLFLGIRS